jgi:hypothetical protein
MTIHRPTYANAKTTLETEITALRRRVASMSARGFPAPITC